MAASLGRVIMVLKNKNMQKMMKMAGTTGYPQTLYGRGASGILRRKMNTPREVAP